MITLEPSWHEKLKDEFHQTYMQELIAFLDAEKKAGKTIYPKETEYFRALELTPLNDVQIVILGQDPYHGYGQAHGLCFSVCPEIRIPPSLKNIYKELQSDLGIQPATHGFLESWAKQGVLLLNATLTVEEGKAGSHQKKGWEKFTDAIIHHVNNLPHPVIFMLWGSYAQKKAAFVDSSRHHILTAPHPSPLSAHRGFLGCQHFSKANTLLKSHNMAAINWELPEI